MERTKMRIHLTILLTACHLIAFSSPTEYVFVTECHCNDSVSDLKLHADVDHEKREMTTFLTGIATNFSAQWLRAYPAMYKDEMECNKLGGEMLRKEVAKNDRTWQQNPGEEQLLKHRATLGDVTPADQANDTRTTYEGLFTGCYFFEYKPADNTCKTCYTNTFFIKTSMDYIRLMIDQELQPTKLELDVHVPLREMKTTVQFYENSKKIEWENRVAKVTCNVSWEMSRNEEMGKVCDGNISIGKMWTGTKEWIFRMKWSKDQNFDRINYSWNVTSPPSIRKLHLFWGIPTRTDYCIDDIRIVPRLEEYAKEQADLVWIKIVGVVGVVIILCICLYVTRDRVKKKKKQQKKKMNPEVEAVPEEMPGLPPATDILFLYSPGNDAFQKLLDDVKNEIRIHCPCRVVDYRAIHEYSEDWSIGPKELIDEWFNHSSNRIVWFDTPQLRAYLRPGSDESTGNDFRKSCLRDALAYARTNHLDLTVLATRHFVCRIKGIPEYVVTTASDTGNPLSWIARGVHYHLPDHMTVLIEMLSGKDITKNENEIAGQGSSNEEERKMNGHKNNPELGNNSDKSGRNGYFSKDGYEIVSTSDNAVTENDGSDSRTSSEIDLRQPLRDPRPIVSPAQKEPANPGTTWVNGCERSCVDTASKYLPNKINSPGVQCVCP